MKHWYLLFWTLLVTVQGFPKERGVGETRSPQIQSHNNIVNKLSVSRDCKPKSNPKCNSKCPSKCASKCASSIAQKAAAEAKAAHAAQNAAGAQASHMVKTQLAEKALQAAKAAEAALAGKQAVVEQLQQEVKESEAVAAENTGAVHQQQAAVNCAVQAAQQAASQHKLLCQAVQLSAQLDKTGRCVLDKVKAGLQEKCHNLAESRSRLAHLQHKLQCACAECAATKQAAHAACEAARAACGNARRKKRMNKRKAVKKRQIKRGR